MRRNKGRVPAALAAALALPLLLIGGTARAAAPDDTVWMRVEVNRASNERGHVKINLPLSLIEVVVDSIDKREFLSEFESEHPSVDLQKMWREVRKMESDEFLTVESEEESVRVWKDREFFRVSIREDRSEDPVVQVRIPLDVMDYLFESKARSWSFQEVVERLRPHLPLTLVEINKQDDYVKVWLDVD